MGAHGSLRDPTVDSVIIIIQRPRPHAADPFGLLGGVIVPGILRGLWRPHGCTMLIMSTLGSFWQAMLSSCGTVEGNLGSWGVPLGCETGNGVHQDRQIHNRWSKWVSQRPPCGRLRATFGSHFWVVGRSGAPKWWPRRPPGAPFEGQRWSKVRFC